MPPRNYTVGDRAALILFGQGRCYWGPGCTEPLLRKVEDRYRMNLQIAHIRSDEVAAERYVSGISKATVDAFENLLFLCKPHHDTIDESGAGARFTIKVLEEWKNEREFGLYDGLRGLRDIDEDELVDRIAEAVDEQNRDIRATLNRLEKTDAEAAALIRELNDEIRELRRSGSVLDPDAVNMLGAAAHDLIHLPDSASQLYMAARDLSHLRDSAAILDRAASNASGLQDVIAMLDSAVERARGMM
ncbi:hypothetical protein [Amycolatopsis sp. WAC 01416]|uniref:hypothetical protein n=1 Tax=Amycolatopsis sp. WAC 01416 TaxID=2203196 RepID=UPI000F7B4DAF|nr:hypothetical protein [Amycolatopsis sp. WAC 01416]